MNTKYQEKESEFVKTYNLLLKSFIKYKFFSLLLLLLGEKTVMSIIYVLLFSKNIMTY